MKGTIEEIITNDLKDGRTYQTLVIDGQKYSLWDKDQFGKYTEGDSIDFEWTSSGRYKNISKIADPTEQKLSLDDDGGNGQQGDEHIMRTCCLKYATQIISELELNPEEKISLALETAQKFENYIKKNDRQLPGQSRSAGSDSIPF